MATTVLQVKSAPSIYEKLKYLNIKPKKKLTYAEACRKYNRATNSPRNADARQSQSLSNLREFPPLPASNGASPINARPYLQQVEKNPAENDVTQTCVELHENSCDALQIDSATNFMFSNPIYFVAFLTEVINQTLLATKTNKEIDIYQIISDSAGKQMGIPIDFEQLKSLT